MMPRRFALLLSALVVALLGATTSISGSGPEGRGTYVTRNGFRAPLFGVSKRVDANGNSEAACAALNVPQVEAARIGRRVSRAMLASSPQAVVRGPAGGANFEVRYTDAEGAGFNHASEGATRRKTLEAALASWAKVIHADQLIRVEASMHEMDDEDNDPNTTLLATAGPTEFWLIDNKVIPS